jgi:glycosyltransferase involved in cell wall biosynthesis
MRRVLIVTNAYAPAMIADMQRARQLAWELPKLGWDVEILAPDSTFQPPSCLDRDSTEFFAPHTPVHFVKDALPNVFCAVRLHSVGWRAFLPLLRKGSSLLRTGRYDLVYLSTANFPLFLLGPMWLKRHSVPFVLDFHDPCYREGPSHPTWARPSLKHAVSHWLSGYIERRAVTTASGIVSVSPNYLDELGLRYEDVSPVWLQNHRTRVIPFAASPRDLDIASGGVEQPRIPSEKRTVVYVGTGGPIMHRSFSLLCRTLAYLRNEGLTLVERMRIELHGTMRSWHSGQPPHLAELAHESGVGDLIEERPSGVTYRRSLELLQDSDGALVLGVDDAGYMPSKLFMYAHSGKPLLAVLRNDGPACAEFLRNPTLGHALWFGPSGEMPLNAAADVLKSFLCEVFRRERFDRTTVLEPFLARDMACRHRELFDSACESTPRLSSMTHETTRALK